MSDDTRYDGCAVSLSSCLGDDVFYDGIRRQSSRIERNDWESFSR